MLPATLKPRQHNFYVNDDGDGMQHAIFCDLFCTPPNMCKICQISMGNGSHMRKAKSHSFANIVGIMENVVELAVQMRIGIIH